jgi:BMFP domain-containing protein YqiC
MTRENPILDGLAKLLTDAAGAAQGAKSEMETFLKQKLEKLIADMDLVGREEFDAVKAMAAKARAENGRLEARLKKLERAAPRPPKKRRIPAKPRAARKL